MPFSIIPFLLLIVPLAEIGAYIVIGREIGVLWTLAMVFVTAVIGSILLRVQGFGLINRIQSEMQEGRVPGRELVHGVMIMIAGVLLLTPGFITDTIGFLLFVPQIRDAGWALLKNRISVVSSGGFAHELVGASTPMGCKTNTGDHQRRVPCEKRQEQNKQLLKNVPFMVQLYHERLETTSGTVLRARQRQCPGARLAPVLNRPKTARSSAMTSEPPSLVGPLACRFAVPSKAKRAFGKLGLTWPVAGSLVCFSALMRATWFCSMGSSRRPRKHPTRRSPSP